MAVIDFHTHILPGIDDGSPDAKTSLKMLKDESLQGVDTVFLTPHFYPDRMSIRGFLKKRESAFQELQEAVGDDTGIPAMMLGAEAAFFPALGESDRVQDLCLEGSRAILLEMPFRQWTENTLKGIRRIISEGLTPVIAHMERYEVYQHDTGPFSELLSMPVTVQINAESFHKMFPSKYALRLMKTADRIVLGTDAHGRNGRMVNMKDGREAVRKRFGNDMLDRIDAESEHIAGKQEKI